MRPIVFHAGCGGEVTVAREASSLSLTCQRCERQIADPLELTPRGTGFTPEQNTTQIARYRLEA